MGIGYNTNKQPWRTELIIGYNSQQKHTQTAYILVFRMDHIHVT